MARILADEQFPARIQDCLRRLGHDVIHTRQLDDSKFGDGKSDEDVLRHAAADQRIVLTLNYLDFRALHRDEVVEVHWGILIYHLGKLERTPAQHADRIHERLRSVDYWRIRIEEIPALWSS